MTELTPGAQIIPRLLHEGSWLMSVVAADNTVIYSAAGYDGEDIGFQASLWLRAQRTSARAREPG